MMATQGTSDIARIGTNKRDKNENDQYPMVPQHNQPCDGMPRLRIVAAHIKSS